MKTRLAPPVHISHGSASNMVWTLFDKYFRYVCQNSSDAYHPISILSRKILESGKASLEAQALTLSVSIETLLMNEMRCRISNQVTEDLPNDICRAKQLITESTALGDSFKQRVRRALEAMERPRAKDVLAELKKRGIIDDDLVKTYGKLRNTMAHGAQDPNIDAQDSFNQTSTVLVLFYQLVFLVIGYKGSYSDYGEYGHPTKEFSEELA